MEHEGTSRRKRLSAIGRFGVAAPAAGSGGRAGVLGAGNGNDALPARPSNAAARRAARLNRTAIVVVALIALSSVLWILRWTTDAVRADGDTFWYTRSALEFAGRNEDDAVTEAARFTVALRGGSTIEGWRALVSSIDPRYPGIFAERPVYPATAVLFVPLLGSGAMIVSAFIAGVGLGCLLGWFVLVTTGSALAAMAATILLFALPSGGFIALLYADGWMLLWWTAALVAASRWLTSGRAAWLSTFLVTCILLGLTKSANEGSLAAGLVAMSAACLIVRRDAIGRRTVPLALVSVAVGVVQAGVFELLGLPGVMASLQDLATVHFAAPDVPDPVQRLVSRDIGWLGQGVATLAGAVLHPRSQPALLLTIGLFLGGVVGLASMRRAWVLPWLFVLPATLLPVLLHPVSTQVPRLVVPLWLSVAAGLAVAVQRLEGALRARTPRSVPEGVELETA